MLMYLIISIIFISSLNAKENCDDKNFPSTIKEKIKLIDSHDFSILEVFFRRLFQQGTFAYTLFEYKPMANDCSFISSMNRARSKKEKDKVIFDIIGWRIWEKYSHLFPSKNFIFKLEYFQDSDPSYQINLFNKKLCIQIVNDHLTEFQKCFGDQITPDDVLKILSTSDLQNEYFYHPEYHSCLGLLFGFGEKNSKAFEQRDVLINLLYQVPYDVQFFSDKQKRKFEYFLEGPQKETKLISIEDHKSIKSINDELDYLQVNFKPVVFLKKFYLNPIKGMVWIGFNDKEKQTIEARYEKAYQQLIDIFNSENFLEIILTQLSS